MKPLHDYLYRFQNEQLRMRGRCRVRIYEHTPRQHTVLLTELHSNSGESITSACERIASVIAATKGLSVKTTRWIQHEPPHDDLPHVFEEIHFTWDSNNLASTPQWQPLQDQQVEALTGEVLSTLNRQLGDLEMQFEESKHETT